MEMPTRRLGSSGLEVSRLSLGSWRTYERITRDDGVEVMTAARDLGITFLDDARYDDEMGAEPIPTGYSEVIFGELFRATGWRRDETVVANKLWWEFWPEQSAADELDASLGRMQLDYVDVIYALPPPAALELEELVEAVAGLITAGKARAWAVVNWSADPIAEVATIASRRRMPQPCAAQLPYSLVQRSPVEDDEMVDALAQCGAPVVASYALAGGVLTGKYQDDPGAGRAAGTLDDPWVAATATAGTQLRALADAMGTSAAALAVAFTLANPSVASTLFGATRPEQVHENAAALELVDTLDRQQLSGLGRRPPTGDQPQEA